MISNLSRLFLRDAELLRKTSAGKAKAVSTILKQLGGKPNLFGKNVVNQIRGMKADKAEMLVKQILDSAGVAGDPTTYKTLVTNIKGGNIALQDGILALSQKGRNAALKNVGDIKSKDWQAILKKVGPDELTKSSDPVKLVGPHLEKELGVTIKNPKEFSSFLERVKGNETYFDQVFGKGSFQKVSGVKPPAGTGTISTKSMIKGTGKGTPKSQTTTTTKDIPEDRTRKFFEKKTPVEKAAEQSQSAAEVGQVKSGYEKWAEQFDPKTMTGQFARNPIPYVGGAYLGGKVIDSMFSRKNNHAKLAFIDRYTDEYDDIMDEELRKEGRGRLIRNFRRISPRKSRLGKTLRQGMGSGERAPEKIINKDLFDAATSVHGHESVGFAGAENLFKNIESSGVRTGARVAGKGLPPSLLTKAEEDIFKRALSDQEKRVIVKLEGSVHRTNRTKQVTQEKLMKLIDEEKALNPGKVNFSSMETDRLLDMANKQRDWSKVSSKAQQGVNPYRTGWLTKAGPRERTGEILVRNNIDPKHTDTVFDTLSAMKPQDAVGPAGGENIFRTLKGAGVDVDMKTANKLSKEFAKGNISDKVYTLNVLGEEATKPATSNLTEAFKKQWEKDPVKTMALYGGGAYGGSRLMDYLFDKKAKADFIHKFTEEDDEE